MRKIPSQGRWRCGIRITALFLVLVMLVSFAGCAQKEQGPVVTEIVMWHWMSDREAAFDVLADKYEKETGIRVKFELYAPTAAYTSKIRSAAQASKLPDVYGVLLQQRDLAAFINAGHVHDLTGYMERDNGQWKDLFYKSALALNSFPENNQYKVKPGIYGVPIDMTNIQLVYNLDLLDAAGWDTSKLPTNWEEFMQLGEKLRQAKISGLVSGWGEAWMLSCFADNYAYNIMGEKKIVKTINGQVPYTDPSWVQVLTLFQEIQAKGMFFPGSVTMVNKEAEQIFANGRAAIAFNGSWCVNVYERMNPDLRYAVALPPKVDVSRSMNIWGGATSFVVNEASNLKKESIDFLRWLTLADQQNYLAAETNNIPANKSCMKLLKGPVAQFADDMDKVVHPRLLPVEEYPLVTEVYNKGIQSIIIEENTPLEISERAEKAKKREIAKAERFKALREKNK